MSWPYFELKQQSVCLSCPSHGVKGILNFLKIINTVQNVYHCQNANSSFIQGLNYIDSWARCKTYSGIVAIIQRLEMVHRNIKHMHMTQGQHHFTAFFQAAVTEGCWLRWCGMNCFSRWWLRISLQLVIDGNVNIVILSLSRPRYFKEVFWVLSVVVQSATFQSLSFLCLSISSVVCLLVTSWLCD